MNRNIWIFMDETGVLTSDPEQPFFALGAMKVPQTAALYEELAILSQRARNRINARFEFKFNRINRTNKGYYIDLVDLFFDFPELYFKAFLVDKQAPGFDMDAYFRSSWEAQIGYAKLLLKNMIHEDECAAVMADYLNKPKAATRYFEDSVTQINSRSRQLIFNVCMLESDASLFIQLVDVMLGLVVYDCKIRRGVHKGNAAKTAVLNSLKGHLSRQDLSTTLDVEGPPYFSIWKFQPYSRHKNTGYQLS